MATQQQRQATDLGEQAIALAEQLGRIAGTIEGTAEAWLNEKKLTLQLMRVRDGAAQMLDGLTRRVTDRRGSKGRKRSKKSAPRARQAADLSRAPGKRHRKPAPTLRGVKKSDEAIPKMRTAEAARQRRKSYA